MGYELRIMRAPDDAPISLAEWLAVVEADPEMRRRAAAEARTPDGVVRIEGPGMATWNSTGFDFRRGRIFVKNPGPQDVEKMKQLAAKLRAKVVGDDGEEY